MILRLSSHVYEDVTGRLRRGYRSTAGSPEIAASMREFLDRYAQVEFVDDGVGEAGNDQLALWMLGRFGL